MARKKREGLPSAVQVLIGFAIGIAVGGLGLFFFQRYNPPDTPASLAPSIVFERVVQSNEMVSATQKYNIVDKATDQNELFGFGIPGTENSFWYRYCGVLKAGVDMSQAKFEQSDSTVTITLPDATILSNTPDRELSGVLEERNNILNPIHIEDVDKFLDKCVARSEEEAIAGGLLVEATENAKTNIVNMFNAAFGDEYTVEFKSVSE